MDSVDDYECKNLIQEKYYDILTLTLAMGSEEESK